MRKSLLSVLLLCAVASPMSAAKKYADLTNPTVVGNAAWDAATKSFSWTASYYAYMMVPNLAGDLSEYTSLIIESENFTEGGTWRVDFELNDNTVLSRLDGTVFYSAGIKTINLREKLSAEQLKDIKTIRINTASAEGSITINRIYLTKPFSLAFDDKGECVVDFTDLTATGDLTFDEATGLLTNNGNGGDLKVDLADEDFRNVYRLEMEHDGDIINTMTTKFKDAEKDNQTWYGSKYGADFTPYQPYAEHVTGWWWNVPAATEPASMTIKKILIKANVISATAANEAELGKVGLNEWTSVDASGTVKSALSGFDDGTRSTPAYDADYNGGALIYGTSSVSCYCYCDMSKFDGMRIFGKGNLRLLFNRQGNDTPPTEIDPAISESGYELRFADNAALSAFDYVHLNAIKVQWGSTANISKIVLFNDNCEISYILSGAGALTSAAQKALADANATCIDATKVTLTAGSLNLTSANANCLFLAPEGCTDNNAIIGSSCGNLQLTDGGNFNAPKPFTATEANYTRTLKGELTTLVLPYEVNIPAGVRAYKLTAGTESVAAEEIQATIPANTPVLIQGTAGEEVTFTASNAAVAETAEQTLAHASLQGTYTNGKVPAGSYILTQKDGVMCFAKVVAGSEPSVTPFRAYLSAPAVQAPVLRITNTTTAIETIEQEEAASSAVVYDAFGRRADRRSAGNIYIVKGKKFIEK